VRKNEADINTNAKMYLVICHDTFFLGSIVFIWLSMKRLNEEYISRRNRISHYRHEPGEDRTTWFTRSGLPMVPALTLSVIGDASNQTRNAECHVSRRPPQAEQYKRSYLHVSTIRLFFDDREKREREYKKSVFFSHSIFIESTDILYCCNHLDI